MDLYFVPVLLIQHPHIPLARVLSQFIQVHINQLLHFLLNIRYFPFKKLIFLVLWSYLVIPTLISLIARKISRDGCYKLAGMWQPTSVQVAALEDVFACFQEQQKLLSSSKGKRIVNARLRGQGILGIWDFCSHHLSRSPSSTLSSLDPYMDVETCKCRGCCLCAAFPNNN